MLGAIPVLDFAAEADGAPPPVLRHGAAGSLARRPSGGDPMLVLRDRADVVRVLNSRSFAMAGGLPAGFTTSGELVSCPLTGAEMQNPDGGLLNMNLPQLRKYRQRLNPLFTPAAALGTHHAIRNLAISFMRATGAIGRTWNAVDVLRTFIEPFTAQAVCTAMGVPLDDWDQILEFSRVAFAVVPSPDAVGAVARAWDALYAYYEPRVARKRQWDWFGGEIPIIGALEGFTATQVVHVLGTVSNGFGALLPVFAVSLIDVAQRPHVIEQARRGETTWQQVAHELLSRRALFPVALPRIALADAYLGDRFIAEGTTVLPSLFAAAHDPNTPPSATIAFGSGPHFCPGAALSRRWLATVLEVFFTGFPRARLAGPLDWQPGTLPIPRQIMMTL